ncbi:MAG: Bax inhibitor-1/YccA family protein [Oscillospiraceae bacterium]|nr:Bax inhibitor-1/YccA family protein [Oscillospiraceae bacterium]
MANYGKGYYDEDEQKREQLRGKGLAGIFGLMFLGLLISAITAFFTAESPLLWGLVFATDFYFLFLAPLGLVIFVFPRVWTMPPAAAIGLFFVYAILNGLTLSVVFLSFNIGLALAFLSTAGMFAAMAVYGAVTQADLSGLGSLLIMGLFGLIVASVLHWFLFPGTAFDMVLSYASIAIFLGLTANHVQRLQKAMAENPSTGTMVQGALYLYLAFLNIFFVKARLMGDRRR